MISRKYLKDYRLDTVTNENGKVQEITVYVGPLYVLEISAKELWKIKIGYLCSMLLGWVLFVVSLWNYSELSKVWYVTISYCGISFPLLLVSVSIYNVLMLKSPFHKEQKEKALDRLKAGSAIGIIVAGLSFIAQMIGYTKIEKAMGADIFLTISAMLFIILMLYDFSVSKRLHIKEIENPNKNFQ